MKYQLVKETSCLVGRMTQAKNPSSYFIMKDCQYINFHLGENSAGFECEMGMLRTPKVLKEQFF